MTEQPEDAKVTPDRGHIRRPRAGNGRYLRQLETAERDAEACRLRVAGATYDQIAAQLGYTDRSLARRACERALLAVVAEPAEVLRTLELARLDAALIKAFKILHGQHVVVSNGRVVLDPGTGQPLVDSAPVLGAIDRILKIGERRAKLLGLDEPVRAQVISLGQIEAEIASLAGQLAITGDVVDHDEGTDEDQ